MKSQLRILIVSLDYPPPVRGGYGVWCQQLAREEGLRRRLVEGGLKTASELTLERQAERIEHWLLLTRNEIR